MKLQLKKAAFFGLIIVVFAFQVPCHGEDSVATVNTGKIDTLVSAGLHFLQKNDLERARHLFTYAYHCGMSKDSMLYFASELYLRKGAVDTALVFNQGLEIRGKFARELILSQRARIYKFMGLYHKSDSLMSLSRKRVLPSFALYTSGIRSIVSTKPFVLAPFDSVLIMDSDIDDIGRIGCTFKLTGQKGTRLADCFALIDAGSGIPVPTQYASDKHLDTLLRSVSVYIGGPITKKIKGLAGYRLVFRGDGSLEHCDREQLYVPSKKTSVFSVMHESRWIKGTGLDYSAENLIYTRFQKRDGYTIQQDLGITHAFDRAYTSRNIKIGYIDTIDIQSGSEQPLHYYRDKEHTDTFPSPFLDEYWSGQQAITLLSIPEHSISVSAKSQIQFPVNKNLLLTFNGELKGVLFPVPLKWYTYGLTMGQMGWLPTFDGDDYIVFHAGDDKYYYNADYKSLNYVGQGMKAIDLQYHEKRRSEIYGTLGLLMERKLKYIGLVYLGTSFQKNYTTMGKNDPVVVMDYLWEFKAGWKKEISIAKK